MFIKDSRTENFLTQMGVEFQYTNGLQYRDLKPGWETRNIGRPVAVREDAVEQYAELMNAGSPAPAPILIKDVARHDILDGVQRLAAAQLSGLTQLSAYVVTCDSDNLTMSIRLLANARLQGRAEPMEWTRRHAVEILVVDKGLSASEVAKMGGWRTSDIEAIAKSIRWSKSIVAIGGPDNLSDAMLNTIADCTTIEAMQKAVVPVSKFLCRLQQTKLSATDAEPLIEAFFQPVAKIAKAHQTYCERLNDFERTPEVQTRISGRKPIEIAKDVNLRRSLRAAENILIEIVDSGCDVNFIDEYFQLLNRMERLLHKVSSRHKSVVVPRVPADMYEDKV